MLISGMRCKDNALTLLVNDLPSGITMAEVGCFAGESTAIFLNSGKINELFAIDPWEKQFVDPNDDMASSLNAMYSKIRCAEQSFEERVKGKSVIKLKMLFSEAVKLLPMLDFIYIDADHRYESVKADIKLALTRLKPNGIIAGHDYYNQFEGVIKAVNETLGKPDNVYADTSWIKRL